MAKKEKCNEQPSNTRCTQPRITYNYDWRKQMKPQSIKEKIEATNQKTRMNMANRIKEIKAAIKKIEPDIDAEDHDEREVILQKQISLKDLEGIEWQPGDWERVLNAAVEWDAKLQKLKEKQ